MKTAALSMFAIEGILQEITRTLPDQAVCALSKTYRSMSQQLNLTLSDRKQIKLKAEQDIEHAVCALFHDLDGLFCFTEGTSPRQVTSQLLQGFDGCVEYFIQVASGDDTHYNFTQGMLVRDLLLRYYDQISFK